MMKCNSVKTLMDYNYINDQDDVEGLYFYARYGVCIMDRCIQQCCTLCILAELYSYRRENIEALSTFSLQGIYNKAFGRFWYL